MTKANEIASKTGYSETYISLVKHGKKVPSSKFLHKLKETGLLDCSESELDILLIESELDNGNILKIDVSKLSERQRDDLVAILTAFLKKSA